MQAPATRDQALRGGTPLAHSRLRVVLQDLLAEYELRHVFRNERDAPIEAVYSFPVPLDAAFLGMEATLAGETRVAQILPAARAARTYDDALAEGDSAVLLEQLEPGMLCVNLGNLKQGEAGEIVLRFASAVAVADRTARFSLPLVHRPRYGRYKLNQWQVPMADFAVEHPLEAEIVIRGLLAARPVQCTSQGAVFRSDAQETVLRLDRAMLDRDLVLNFDLGDGSLSSSRWVEDGEQGIGILTLMPTATGGLRPAPTKPIDLCLLLDCSGSMNGDAIRQSRNALRYVAEALCEEDRIQVLRFGSSTIPMFRRPLKASRRVRETLGQLLPAIQSDLGGTDMDDAIHRALDQLEALEGASEQKVIILVTDGAVQASEIEDARERAAGSGTRIFVVAVGSSAGADVLAPLAAMTGGVLERAVPAEPVEDCVMRQFRRARALRPLEIAIDWQGQHRQLPVGNVYQGDAVVAVAFLGGLQERQVHVRIPGTGDDIRFALNGRESSPAWRAWAGQQAYPHAVPGEREALALRYGLVAKETSAVLVKVRAEADKSEGLPVIVPVAHMVPEGMVAARSGAAKAGRVMVACRMPPAHLLLTDDYLDTPVFSRRSRVLDPVVPEADRLSPERKQRVRHALRKALDELLFASAESGFSKEDLMGLIDPALHEDVHRYLDDESIDLLTGADACKLLEDLHADGIGPELTDEQEAVFSAWRYSSR